MDTALTTQLQYEPFTNLNFHIKIQFYFFHSQDIVAIVTREESLTLPPK